MMKRLDCWGKLTRIEMNAQIDIKYYYAQTTVTVSASHKLKLDYESPCQRLHGHNWKITLRCCAPKLNNNGMVADFALMKKFVKDLLDHQDLTDNFPQNLNPTAENIAEFLLVRINGNREIVGPYATCFRIDVEETEGNIASVEINKRLNINEGENDPV